MSGPANPFDSIVTDVSPRIRVSEKDRYGLVPSL